MNEPIRELALEGITKRFPGILACNRVSLEVRRGEALALVGENGAGKSTLMNILAGLYQPDEGSIRVNGEVVRFASPADAFDRGIGMVHQNFMLVPSMKFW
ncbi:MAG: ATP-binding cassette domain-containing protein, partial [Deltaproteobacteria bacterium]